MADFILGTSDTEQWRDLIIEAQAYCGNTLPEDIESYLVFLLQRFMRQPELAESVLAVEYLESVGQPASLKKLKLRDVGDKCLLFAGLFPEYAERKRVDIAYFIELGQSAYTLLAELHSGKMAMAELYERLGLTFVPLMSLLHGMRELGNQSIHLSPLQAHTLWQKTGSRYALSILSELTDSLPVSEMTSFSKKSLH